MGTMKFAVLGAWALFLSLFFLMPNVIFAGLSLVPDALRWYTPLFVAFALLVTVATVALIARARMQLSGNRGWILVAASSVLAFGVCASSYAAVVAAAGAESLLPIGVAGYARILLFSVWCTAVAVSVTTFLGNFMMPRGSASPAPNKRIEQNAEA